MNVIEKNRKKIDKIDEKIIKNLITRFKLTNEIGKYKKNNDIKIKDLKREKEIFDNIYKYTDNKKEQDNIREIYKKILLVSKRNQV